MRGFRVLSASHPPLPSLPGAIGSTEASDGRLGAPRVVTSTDAILAGGDTTDRSDGVLRGSHYPGTTKRVSPWPSIIRGHVEPCALAGQAREDISVAQT